MISEPRRAVVTGADVVSPVGVAAETWAPIRVGRSGIAPITLFDTAGHSTRFAGEVKAFDPLLWLDCRDLRKRARFTQLVIAATTMAMATSDQRVTVANATRVGVMIGSGIGGFEIVARGHPTLLERVPKRISPFFIVAAIVNLAAGQVAVRAGAKGRVSSVAAACSTSAHSISDAFRLIPHGYADAMICGGSGGPRHAARDRRVSAPGALSERKAPKAPIGAQREKS